MYPEENPEVFIFFHIPKTGGTSVNHLLRKNLKLGHGFIQLDDAGERDDRKNHRLPFPERSLEERMAVRAIAGHEVNIRTESLFPNKIPQRITFFRKTADRILSAFNYETSDASNSKWDATVSFDTWYAQQERDVITKFLVKRLIANRLRRAWVQGQRLLQYRLRRGASSAMFEQVQRELKKFLFVGCTEHLNRDFPFLAARMNIHGEIEKRNAAGRNFSKRLELTPELEARLERENSWDTRLYQYWHDRLEESVQRLQTK